MSLTGKHILILVGGGIAACKIPDLVRRMPAQLVADRLGRP